MRAYILSTSCLPLPNAAMYPLERTEPPTTALTSSYPKPCNGTKLIRTDYVHFSCYTEEKTESMNEKETHMDKATFLEELHAA